MAINTRSQFREELHHLRPKRLNLEQDTESPARYGMFTGPPTQFKFIDLVVRDTYITVSGFLSPRAW